MTELWETEYAERVESGYTIEVPPFGLESLIYGYIGHGDMGDWLSPFDKMVKLHTEEDVTAVEWSNSEIEYSAYDMAFVRAGQLVETYKKEKKEKSLLEILDDVVDPLISELWENATENYTPIHSVERQILIFVGALLDYYSLPMPTAELRNLSKNSRGKFCWETLIYYTMEKWSFGAELEYNAELVSPTLDKYISSIKV